MARAPVEYDGAMRKLAVVGATGRLGEIVVNRALADGLEVHAFGRRLERLAQRFNDRLSAFHGDLLTGEGLQAAVHGCRFVVCAFELERPATAKAISHLLPLLKAPPLAKLVFISPWRSKAPAGGLVQRFSAWRRHDQNEDLDRAEQLLRASKLPWVILHTSGYVDAPAGKEVFATEATDAPPARVGRSALAKFIMELLHESAWQQREATVSGARVAAGAPVLKVTRSTTLPGVPLSTLLHEPAESTPAGVSPTVIVENDGVPPAPEPAREPAPPPPAPTREPAPPALPAPTREAAPPPPPAPTREAAPPPPPAPTREAAPPPPPAAVVPAPAPEPTTVKTVVFASVGNAGRSQMAAAWFNALADPRRARAVSAGTQPSPRVYPSVVEVMREVGFELSNEKPKLFTLEVAAGAALVVRLGGEGGPSVPGARTLEWPADEPLGLTADSVRVLRNELCARVAVLLRDEGWLR